MHGQVSPGPRVSTICAVPAGELRYIFIQPDLTKKVPAQAFPSAKSASPLAKVFSAKRSLREDRSASESSRKKGTSSRRTGISLQSAEATSSSVSAKLSDNRARYQSAPPQLFHPSVVSLTLLYISRMLKKVLRVTLNEVKGLMYLKRRDSSLRSE